LGLFSIGGAVVKLFFALLLTFSFKNVNAQVSFEQNPFEKADPFQYLSVRSDFWNEFNNRCSEKNNKTK
jgi:hypothetical protein